MSDNTINCILFALGIELIDDQFIRQLRPRGFTPGGLDRSVKIKIVILIQSRNFFIGRPIVRIVIIKEGIIVIFTHLNHEVHVRKDTVGPAVMADFFVYNLSHSA